jgi:hypothetical protein
MADTNTQQGKLVADSSLIPYIRRQDVVFEASNLRPRKMARLFFDEIVMNQYAQKGNYIVLDSKKVLSITPNAAVSVPIYTNDIVYQGSSNVAPSFSAIVESYNSGTKTLTIKTMSGNFDESANILVENVTTGITTATANISNVLNSETSDIFFKGEGLYCSNSNVYVTVLGSSGENILYVNENYIACNIGVISPNNLSLMSGDFRSGDLVFQSSTGERNVSKATFRGKVEYYNNAVGANTLVITAISGKMNVNTSTTNLFSRLWNSSNTAAKALQVFDTKEYNFANNDLLISTANTNKRVTVTSHVHHSGAIANSTANTVEGGGQYVYVNSTDLTHANGNLIYFTAGTGLGQFRRVTAVSGKRLTLATALTTDPNQTTKYSIGNFMVDEAGSIAGILNIPEEPNFKFKTGERVFTITDVDQLDSDDYTMKASAKFSAGGLLNATQRINMTPISNPLPEFTPNNPVAPIPPTQRTTTSVTRQLPITRSRVSLVPRLPIGDPIAQTFFTPKPDTNKVNYGIFVTSIDLFFSNKPSLARGSLQLPVSVKIAATDNGYPTKNYIASATVKAKDVKISTNPSVSDLNTVTKFIFDDPVYLQADTEYALIIMSESPEYEVYVAELGGNVLGADPPRRISEQPYAGSFFRSQNSSTWTAYQNEDLMFVINKAVFSNGGSAQFALKEPPLASKNVDKLMLNVDRLAFPTAEADFKVKSVFRANGNYDVFNYIKPQREFKYGDLLDASNKQSSANFLNTRRITVGNSQSLILNVEFATSDTDLSPVFNMETLSVIAGEHIINNAGISNTIISLTNRGVGYNAVSSSGNTIAGSANSALNDAAQAFRQNYLANNYNIGFYNLTITGGEGSGATGWAVANTNGDNTVDYVVINSEGSGYIETPTITIANGNSVSNVSASVSVQGETGPRGGNIKAKYLTRQIALEDGFEAGDLRIFMDTVRPNGTDIQVYYKVLGSEDPDKFSEKPWVRMFKTVDRKSKNSTEVVELQFRPDLLENKLKYVENGIQYPIGGKFKYFAIKVCMTAVDSTVAPFVRNLRIIAIPEG